MLVTLDLGAAVGVYLIGKEDTARDVLRKVGLDFRQRLIACFDMQSHVIVDDYDRITGRDVAALSRFGGKRYASRGIDL
jgi:hypothetical protein